MIHLVITFFSLFLLGIGYTVPLNQKSWSSKGISLWVAPLIGYSILSIIGMFYIHYNWSPLVFRFLILFLTAGSVLIYIGWFLKNNESHHFQTSPLVLYVIIFIFSLIVLNIFFNPVQGHELQHRLASDLPSYLAASKHLLEGGDLSSAQDHLFANEIFNRAYRWGFPAAVSYLAWTHQTRVEYVIFSLPLIIYVSSLISAFFLLSKTSLMVNKKSPFLYLIPILMVFNVGVIYYLFEGFYPQIISIGVLTFVLATFFKLREEIGFEKPYPWLWVVALVSASVILTYSEAYVILALSVGGILFLDLIFKNKACFKMDLLVIAAISLSPILIFPFIKQFVLFTLANTANLGNIGFTFPSRPYPSDWVGLSNIFSDVKLYFNQLGAPSKVRNGSIYPEPVDIILSLWVLYEGVRFFKNQNKKNKAFFLVPIIGILCFLIANTLFVKVFKTTTHYYMYNKTITLFLPLVTFIFLNHLFQSAKNRKWLLASLLSVLSFILFVKDSRAYKSSIDLNLVNYFNEHPHLSNSYLFIQNERGNRNGAVIGKYRYIDRAGDFLLYSLIPIDFFDSWDFINGPQISPEMQSKEIVVLVNQDYVLQDSIASLPKDRVLFRAGKYIAVLTGIPLKSIVDKPREEWAQKLQRVFIP